VMRDGFRRSVTFHVLRITFHVSLCDSLTSLPPVDTLRTVTAENESQQNNAKKFQGPGGTPGGLGLFIFGLALAIAGAYLIMSQVQVASSGYWSWLGTNTFGLTLLPLVIGLGLLFFDGRSIAGWVLAGGGAVIIFVGILANLQIYFQHTSLFNVIVMLTLFAAGLGLMARALKSS
jgi:uncharacterized protein